VVYDNKFRLPERDIADERKVSPGPDQRSIHVRASIGGGAFPQFFNLVIFEKAGKRVVADGIRHPDGDGLVGVVFHDEEGAGGMHVSF